jgi:hypothetical protein
MIDTLRSLFSGRKSDRTDGEGIDDGVSVDYEPMPERLPEIGESHRTVIGPSAIERSPDAVRTGETLARTHWSGTTLTRPSTVSSKGSTRRRKRVRRNQPAHQTAGDQRDARYD